MRKVIFIKPDYTHGALEVGDDELSLDLLQGLVEGHIEVAQTILSPGWCREYVGRPVMIVNEEGKLRHLPYNEDATFLATSDSDFIVGTAVLAMAEGDSLMGFLPEAADNIIKQWLD